MHPALKHDPSLPGKPFIPKRGEKDYEPRPTGSSLQQHMLEKSRAAMFDAIGSARGVNRCGRLRQLSTISKPTSPARL